MEDLAALTLNRMKGLGTLSNFVMDVNKDTTLKARTRARTMDSTFKARIRTKDLAILVKL